VRVVVVGAGILGLSAARVIAERGHAVELLDRHRSGHPATSSAGATRTFRLAYAEPAYVRLALRSRERWLELAARTGETTYVAHGQVEVGEPVAAIAGTLADLAVPHELVDDPRRYFPELALDGPALWHPGGGVLLAPGCLRAQHALLQASGGRTSAPERVLAVEPDGDDVTVRTERRTIEADVVVVATGPWAAELLEPLGLAPPLGPGVAQVTFLEAPGLVARPAFAAWVAGAPGMYGHAVPGVGYKFGIDAANGEDWRPDAEAWGVDAQEEATLLGWVREHLPSLEVRPLRSERHPWTMTPDGDQVVDRRGRVVVLAGCSGHAFKLAPALGEAVADLVDGVDPGPDVAHLRLDRPALAGAAGHGLGSMAIPR
jgi:glycine/D-amino acid oxidase-like deaminating enzyme